MPDAALPPHLRETLHWDWPTFFTITWRGNKIRIGFAWVPRGWTAFAWGKPRLIGGRATCATYDYANGKACEADGPMCHPKPINPAGTWQISRFPDAPWWAWPAVYVSWSGERGKDGKARNIRVGMRWDNVDGYVNWGWPISAALGVMVAVFTYFFHPVCLMLLPLAFGPSSRRFTGGDDQDTSTL